ncbi:hypothetical protein SAMD00019534_108680 [Acytostelium subglobosum LB1]|uniref:hypothetical protein n=1 Tax=Acytostelium subglobosum LB1 TaxID=1410327 RepID=UPI000644C9F3|nr:hypothetical protein SAMD00019534_108680 [Acytostelium subglobosum LB1]GAM27692.1 hypothetical protein SAMD00019534_108680 [Acytostelium subglobosum LB1]|eukprot:XP_012749351.1 hypothetical protein SAMD00019534_108680 [Acytostelium subglobosum LB1]
MPYTQTTRTRKVVDTSSAPVLSNLANTTSASTIRPVNNRVGVDDLVMLPSVSEAALNDNVQKRYKEGIIYTSIGPVLISCNPYKQLGIYGKEYIDLYKGKHEFEIPPHIYSVADKAYRALQSEHENQCIIISGESGAGKTEASKYIMQYIASITGSSRDVERVKNLILESNPLLEAFGNAKTLRNNNSSRFGKYMEIQFNYVGDPEGGKITNYLLEKSRVVLQTVGERNFHVFYQLLTGATPEEREQLSLLQPDKYEYLNKSRCYTADGIDDAAALKATRHAMEVVGITADEQKQIFKLLSSVLLLGNVTFNSNKQQKAEVADKAQLKTLANLMGVDAALLESSLVVRVVTAGPRKGETIRVLQNVEQASAARDALAKAIYSKLFDWLVRTINRSIEVKTKGKVIGVLDVYGFEIFQNNSFEQFCINYVNETLQQIFIDLTLKTEQEEYVSEGIKWVPVDYVNNKPCVDLIEKKPFGILAILDEECLFPEGNDASLLEKLGKLFAAHSHYSKVPLTSNQRQFIINHYAGKVYYNIDGFLDKNRDTLFNDLIGLATSSSLSLLVEVFQYVPVIEEIDPNVESAKSLDRLKKTGFANQQAKSIIPTDKKRPITAGFQFKSQVTALLKSLYSCNPHYIRCIKPNEVKRALDWDAGRSSEQIRYLGLYENLLVRRAGYCYRQTYAKFMRRYYMIGKKTWPKWEGDAKNGAEILLAELGIPQSEYQFGVNKIFIRNPQPLFDLEDKRTARIHQLATMLQATWKMYKTRRWYLQTLAAIKIQRAYRSWLLRKECVQLKNHSQNIFQGRKERNRNSLVLSSIAFYGDFLSLSTDAYVRQVLTREEGPQAAVRLSVQVSKINRHHKIQKRALIVTNANVFHIVPLAKPKKDGAWFTLKRTIPLGAIERLSCSKLRDNFFVIHVDQSQKADYICETNRKTVFITLLSKLYQKHVNKTLTIDFSDEIAYRSQKGATQAVFQRVDTLPKEQLFVAKPSKNSIKITVVPGESADSSVLLKTDPAAASSSSTTHQRA